VYITGKATAINTICQNCRRIKGATTRAMISGPYSTAAATRHGMTVGGNENGAPQLAQ
jgi:hypothetical protein